MKKEVYNQSVCLVNEVAYLYYIKQLPVVTIANELHVSQSTVSRSIKRAKKEDIITFNMNSNALSCIQMEQRIKEHFKLKNCFVVPSFSNTFISEDPIKVKKRVALEGARYLQRIVNDEDTIGIAWGRTMYHLIHYLNPCQRRGSKIVTLHGSIENVNPKFNVGELAHRAAMAFGGKQYLLTHRGILNEQELSKINFLLSPAMLPALTAVTKNWQGIPPSLTPGEKSWPKPTRKKLSCRAICGWPYKHKSKNP